jgi:2'-5' RNA ligase
MRLFVAIDLPDDTRGAIAREQERLARLLDRSDLRWVPPEQIHLTLAFIGQSPEERLPFIAEAVSEDIQQPPFLLVFGGYGMFPPNGAPRVLWIGVEEGAREVLDLQHEVVRRLERAGVAREDRVFRPHLTLARWRRPRRSDRSRVTSTTMKSIPASTVEGITLYESRMSRSGATHFVLTKARLGRS